MEKLIMEATILAQNPFLIPYGTRIRLTRKSDNISFTALFCGYHTFGIEFLTSLADFFPVFQVAETVDRKPYTMNAIANYDLKKWKLEILGLPTKTDGKHLKNIDPEEYSDQTVNAVAVRTMQLYILADSLSVKEIDFEQHPDIEPPSAVFDNGRESFKYLPVRKLVFDENEILIRILTNDPAYSGYLDDSYGDFFDIGQSFPRIFRAAMQILQKTAEYQEGKMHSDDESFSEESYRTQQPGMRKTIE